MTEHLRRPARALIAVSDKFGVAEFARELIGYGIEIVSTGGTRQALVDAGLAVTDVSDLTGFPAMMDGRVKTLHPAVHGGILAVRNNAAHAEAMREHRIRPIDLVVVNLYPFEETVARGASFADCIENIDIGGPAMIRAAAKNHDDVAVVVEPADYAAVLDEFARHGGMTTLALRRRLAAKAFARTAAYDAAIANWFANELDQSAPDYRAVAGRLIEELRYGENPHQSASFYRLPEQRFGVATARQVQGKQLSYNNINDTDAAYECVGEFDPARTAVCVIIKHANPCGVAEGDNLAAAYRKALACDPVSAFGGVVAVNRTLDADAARAITEIFTEVIIAPDASDEAIAIVGGKKNLRLLLAGGLPDPRAQGLSVKTVAGGLLAAIPRQRRGRRNGIKAGDEARAHQRGAARSALCLPRRQARQIEYDCLRQGLRDGRHRRRSDEPGGFGAHCRAQGRGRREGCRCERAGDQRICGRVRRVLSVRRWAFGRNRGRRHGCDSAGRFSARR